MAISTVATATVSGTTGNASITHGLTIQADDSLTAQIITNGNVQITGAPAGWVPVSDMGEVVNNAYTYVYRKDATSSEPSSYTWTLSGNDSWAIILRQHRGDRKLEWDVEPSSSTRSAIVAADGTSTAPAISVSAGAMALAFVFADSSGGTIGAVGNSFGTQSAVTSTRVMAMAQRLFASAGSTGTTPVTVTASNAFRAIWHAALRETAEASVGLAPIAMHYRRMFGMN